MLKGITAICLAIGLLVVGSNDVKATHVIPEVGLEATIGNICYDTKKYYEEIQEAAKDQGFQAGKDKYWAVMADKDTPCYAGMLVAVVVGEMISETKNLETLTGQCFHSQIWEVFPVSADPVSRKAYTNWHVTCPNRV